MSDSITIKKRVELINEIRSILEELDLQELTPTLQNIKMNKVDDLQTTVLKGILFDYYSSIKNLSTYNNVNERLKWYLEKVNKAVSEEDYEIREN